MSGEHGLDHGAAAMRASACQIRCSALPGTRALLADHHGITHATLQVEPDIHHGFDEVTW